MIRIPFVINGFSDSLHLADDHKLSDAEIEAMKQARFDAWYALVTAPVEEPPVEVLE